MKHRILLWVTVMFTGGTVVIGAWQTVAAQTMAFIDANVVTMDEGDVLEGQTVIVRDGVVVAIGPVDELETPADADVVNAEGRYLMPGLADMHVHLGEPDEYINYLAHGVTTVMSLGAPRNRSMRIRDDRDAVRRDETLGPNIIATGRILDGAPPTGGGSSLQSLATPEAAVSAVAELDEAGFDFVKIYNNVSREVFDAIVAESAVRNLPLVGHIPRNIDPSYTLSNGIDLVAHAEEFFFTVFRGPRSTRDIDKSYRPDLSLIHGLVEALSSADVSVTPNLSYLFSNQVMWDGLENVWTDPEMAYLAPAKAREWRRGNLNRRDNLENFVYRDGLKYALMQELVRHFQAADIPMLLGTDASIEALFPGKSAHRELRELVKAGLTNGEALAIATRNAGDFASKHLPSSERFGRIAVGYRADLLLIDENPLDDVRNVQRIAGVMVRGRWLDRAQIDDRRAGLARQYAMLNEIGEVLSAAAEEGSLAASAAELMSLYSQDDELTAEIERSINSVGYARIGAGQLSLALDAFEINTNLFPGSANAWDSLAETYLALGDRDKSIKLYRKALEVDPSFDNARAQLELILRNK